MRLFVALPLPPDVRSRLGAAQELLRSSLRSSDLRWQDLESSHLTLVFLGEVPESSVPSCRFAVTETAREAEPFTLETHTLGAFPATERASVLWLGVTGEVDRLASLQSQLSERLSDLTGAPSSGTFRPHLTLARVRRMAAVDRRKLPELLSTRPTPSEWRVDRLQLIDSRLSSRGADYRTLLEAPLISQSG